MITIRVDTSEKMDDVAAEEFHRFLSRGRNAVLAATLHLETVVKRWHSRPGSGRMYRVKRSAFRLGPRSSRSPVRWHQASAPGEPPAPDTGALKRAIGHQYPTTEAGTIRGMVGTNAVQARRLEYGGRDGRGVYIAPRPAWGPATLEAEARMDAIINEAMQ